MNKPLRARAARKENPFAYLIVTSGTVLLLGVLAIGTLPGCQSDDNDYDDMQSNRETRSNEMRTDDADRSGTSATVAGGTVEGVSPQREDAIVRDAEIETALNAARLDGFPDELKSVILDVIGPTGTIASARTRSAESGVLYEVTVIRDGQAETMLYDRSGSRRNTDSTSAETVAPPVTEAGGTAPSTQPSMP